MYKAIFYALSMYYLLKLIQQVLEACILANSLDRRKPGLWSFSSFSSLPPGVQCQVLVPVDCGCLLLPDEKKISEDTDI